MRVLIWLVCLSFSISALAQAPRIQLTENSVVKDSSGAVYPSVIWKALLMQGYFVKPVDPKDANTEFLLVKLSEKQLEQRMEKMPKPKESLFFKTGQKFLTFKTTDINGKKVDLKGMDGKIIVLNFWFVDCSPCRTE